MLNKCIRRYFFSSRFVRPWKKNKKKVVVLTHRATFYYRDVVVCIQLLCLPAISLRIVLSHLNQVHSDDNFHIVCSLGATPTCRKIFYEYDTFYKHVRRKHDDIYRRSLQNCILGSTEKVFFVNFHTLTCSIRLHLMLCMFSWREMFLFNFTTQMHRYRIVLI